MRQLLLGAAVVFFCASRTSYASTADIFIFLENNPVQGVEVLLNGSSLGLTNKKGEISSDVDSTDTQTLTIKEKDKTILEKEFTLNSEQDAEISITLSKTSEPKFSIYKSGDDDSKAFGFFSGKVTTTAGVPISDAYISIQNTDISALTDTAGTFNFTLKRGKYDVLISHQEYANQTLDNIRIIAHIGTGALVKLAPKTQETRTLNLDIAPPTEEVVILGTFTADENDSFQLEQMATTVVDAIDMEQIIRLGDSNVASVLKRVVGITIKDGKYAVVRGLEGRYIAPLLNKNLMPTTDPFIRDAELDLFPADILGGIAIQKSYSADVPASSSAATIFINTRDMPKEYINKVNLGLGYNTDVSGKDFLTSQSGSTDDWGFDSGYRELPDSVYQATNGGLDFSVCQIDGQQDCVSQEDAAFQATRLRNNWGTKTDSAGTNYNVGYTLGNVWDLDAGAIGSYFSIDFAKEYKSKIDAFKNSPVGIEGKYSDDTIETSLNAYLVTGFELNDGSTIDSKTFLLRNTESTTRDFEGFDNSEDGEFRTVNIEWKERQVLGQQFSGLHYLPYAQEIEWRLGASQTTSDIPDRKSYTYFGDFLSFSTVERMWSNLEEDAFDVGLDYLLPIGLSSNWRTDIKFGGLLNKKERTNEIVRLGINRPRLSLDDDIETLLQAQTFFDDNLRLRAFSTDTDEYSGEQETSAVYISTETHYKELVSLILGARQESFEQSLEFPNDNDDPSEPFTTDGLYPVVGAIYRPTDSWQVRTSWSQTLSRPSITESAPSLFYNDRSQALIGNPDLEESTIDNIDLRFDYYFGEENSISLAFFSKEIDKPIEVTVVDGSGSATSALTWTNEDKASLSGLELDIYWQAINTNNHLFFIGANAAIINSEVTLSDNSARLQLEDNRELQGLSPALGNIQLGYDHFPSGQKVTFMVNYFDDRIDITTRRPEKVIYEKGRAIIDLNYEVPFLDDQASVKLKVKNLTNEAVEFEQNGRIIEGWKNGSKISLGLSYKF